MTTVSKNQSKLTRIGQILRILQLSGQTVSDDNPNNSMYLSLLKMS